MRESGNIFCEKIAFFLVFIEWLSIKLCKNEGKGVSLFYTHKHTQGMHDCNNIIMIGSYTMNYWENCDRKMKDTWAVWWGRMWTTHRKGLLGKLRKKKIEKCLKKKRMFIDRVADDTHEKREWDGERRAFDYIEEHTLEPFQCFLIMLSYHVSNMLLFFHHAP